MLVSRVFCSLVVRHQPPTSLTRSILSQALPPPSGKETSDSEAQQKTGKYSIKYLVVLVDFSTNQFIDIYPKRSVGVLSKLGTHLLQLKGKNQGSISKTISAA